MSVATSRTFRSGNSEAIRLPRDVGFGLDVDVTMIRSGDVLTIFPTRPSVAELVETLNRLPKPSGIEERDTEAIPEPEGL
jgi:antitoxin VapB